MSTAKFTEKQEMKTGKNKMPITVQQQLKKNS